MAHTTIEQFATELKLPPGALLEQLAKAGVAGKNEGDDLSELDKTKLLEYLQKQHGAAGEPKKKITLTRKQTTAIKAAGSSGKAPSAKTPTEGTLHRPAAKPGERSKPVKKSGAGFQEEAARRRALKLRGDVTGGTAANGWRQPKVGPRRHDEEGVEGAAQAST